MHRPLAEVLADLAAIALVTALLFLALVPFSAWWFLHRIEEPSAALRSAPLVWRQLANSLSLAFVVSGGALALAIPAGYAFSRRAFAGRTVALALATFALVAPAPLLLVGFVETSILAGTRGTVSIMTAALLGTALPSAVWLATLAFRAVPSDLLDAARLDGLSERRVLWRVAAPLAARSLASIGAGLISVTLGEQLATAALLVTPELQTLPAALAGLPAEGASAALLTLLVGVPAVVSGALGLPGIARLLARTRPA